MYVLRCCRGGSNGGEGAGAVTKAAPPRWNARQCVATLYLGGASVTWGWEARECEAPLANQTEGRRCGVYRVVRAVPAQRLVGVRLRERWGISKEGVYSLQYE